MTLLGPNGSPISSQDHARPRKNAGKPAVGEITHISGRILDARGEPIRSAGITPAPAVDPRVLS